MGRVNFIKTAKLGIGAKSGARHLRRKAKRLAKKYPAEVAKVQQMLEDRKK